MRHPRPRRPQRHRFEDWTLTVVLEFAKPHQVTPGHAAATDLVERALEPGEVDHVLHALETGRLEVGGDAPPHLASALDRGVRRVDPVQRRRPAG